MGVKKWAMGKRAVKKNKDSPCHSFYFPIFNAIFYLGERIKNSPNKTVENKRGNKKAWLKRVCIPLRPGDNYIFIPPFRAVLYFNGIKIKAKQAPKI